MSQADLNRAQLLQLHVKIHLVEVERLARETSHSEARGVLRGVADELRCSADRMETSLDAPPSHFSPITSHAPSSWGGPDGYDSGTDYQQH